MTVCLAFGAREANSNPVSRWSRVVPAKDLIVPCKCGLAFILATSFATVSLNFQKLFIVHITEQFVLRTGEGSVSGHNGRLRISSVRQRTVLFTDVINFVPFSRSYCV